MENWLPRARGASITDGLMFLLIIVLLFVLLVFVGLTRMSSSPPVGRSESSDSPRAAAASDVVVCIHGACAALSCRPVQRRPHLRLAGYMGTAADFAHIKRRLRETHGDAVLVIVPECNAGIGGADCLA